MNKRKLIILTLATLILVASGVTYNFYSKIYCSNLAKDISIYIPTSSDFETVLTLLEPHLKNTNSFVWVAKKKNYPNVLKSGKYDLQEGMNNNEIVDLLRSGNQTPIKLSFNNQDTLEKLAGRIAEQIEPDSTTILHVISDLKFLEKNKFSKETVLSMFIPNSYEFYWNTSAEKFRKRMLKEYNTFWSSKRKAQAKKHNLSILEVSTLASIIQKETQNIKERPKVAQLYLNRLNNNWPLQADPTIIFAIKEKQGQHVTIKRVLLKDLKIKSKYNTYINRGLPPGPISMPDISSIAAVLNPAPHNYFYMCADVENIGEHVFARTLSQHNRNAVKYQQWVSKKGIHR